MLVNVFTYYENRRLLLEAGRTARVPASATVHPSRWTERLDRLKGILRGEPLPAQESARLASAAARLPSQRKNRYD